MLPTLTFDESKNDTYTFTLFRDGKEVVHQFKGFSVTLNEAHETVIHGASSIEIYSVDPESLIPADKEKPAPDPNMLYYISVHSYQGEDTFIPLTKEEGEILAPILSDIKDNIYYERYECEFTRTTLRDMHLHPEKYGPEQLRRAGVKVYKEDEEDEYDPNEECDYCHGPVGRCGGTCSQKDMGGY
jgi:hypothetical protein